MAEPTLLFAAVEGPEGSPSDSIQFQINPEALTSPQEAGRWIHNLRLHLAQAMVDFGKGTEQMHTWHDIMTAEGAEVDKMIYQAQQNPSFKAEF